MYTKSLCQIRKTIGYGIRGIQKPFLKPFAKNADLNDAMRTAFPQLIKHKQEEEKTMHVQNNLLQFYSENTIAPYIPLCAKGPWIITETGAVVYDVGGYGMLGFGHAPEWATEILAKPHVMANIMTPQRTHKTFTEQLIDHIGVHAYNTCPYSHFAFLNSGSECMDLAIRISDLKKKETRETNNVFITLRHGFHGRTHMAAKLSHSSRKSYHKYLQSFCNNNVYTIDINDCQQCFDVFHELLNRRHIQAVIMEPVMGEGNPGVQIEKEFYTLVRKLTKQHDAQLIIDSVQAGIRTNGYLSVIDYPELDGIDPPDIEIFSKLIHSGQYPLSILATTQQNAQHFQANLYGNTMTGNPKALEIGSETLNRIDKTIIQNIQCQGVRFKTMLQDIQKQFPHIVKGVSGKGLLLALHIHSDYKVNSKKGLEYLCRCNGLNVIHGGENALRFTPHLQIDDCEIRLIYHLLVQSLNDLEKTEHCFVD